MSTGVGMRGGMVSVGCRWGPVQRVCGNVGRCVGVWIWGGEVYVGV